MVKFFFVVLLLTLIGVSLGADYLWKRWVARQRQYRERHPDEYRR